MPIPKPNRYEDEDSFIERFMADDVMVEDYEDEKQRLAVCQTQLEDNRKNICDNKNNNNM